MGRLHANNRATATSSPVAAGRSNGTRYTVHGEGASSGLAGGASIVTCHAMGADVEHTKTPWWDGEVLPLLAHRPSSSHDELHVCWHRRRAWPQTRSSGFLAMRRRAAGMQLRLPASHTRNRWSINSLGRRCRCSLLAHCSPHLADGLPSCNVPITTAL